MYGIHSTLLNTSTNTDSIRQAKGVPPPAPIPTLETNKQTKYITPWTVEIGIVGFQNPVKSRHNRRFHTLKFELA